MSVKTSERERQRQKAKAYRQAEQTVQIPKLSTEDRKRRARLEADNEAWIWEMFGPKSELIKPLSRPFTSQDQEMIGVFFESLQYGGDELMLASRGGGKTTNLRECLVKALLTGVLTYGAYFGATKTHADYTLEFIKYAIAESAGIQRYYPEVAIPIRAVGATAGRARGMLATGVQFDDVRKKFQDFPIQFQWSTSGLIFPRVPGSPSYASVFQSFGLDSAVRGLNILNRRPDGVFIDDPDTMSTVTNYEQAKLVLNRIDLDIGGLKGEGKKMCRVVIATMSSEGEGVAFRLSDEKSAFVVRRHSFLIKCPAEGTEWWNLWMKYVQLRQKGKSKGDKYGREAARFYEMNREDMDCADIVEVANQYRFDNSPAPDGTPLQLSALQYYFDEWADKGERFCRCELDNERVKKEHIIESKIDAFIVANCADDFERCEVDPATTIVTRGVDVRKIELHYVTGAESEYTANRITDYNVRSHGTSETTVQQAERLILDGLYGLVKLWDDDPAFDNIGTVHACDLTLIDKGWLGNWKEDGEVKTWATQPVETFCLEMGLDKFLPAKGAPNYRQPAPGKDVIIGDHWHINLGEGKERRCAEVIWDANHWHLLIEGMFMLPDDDPDKFVLFQSGDDIWTNHKRFGEHIANGASEMKKQMAKGVVSRKPRFVRDHWFDSSAMMLVAKSIVKHKRAAIKADQQTRSARRKPTPDMPQQFSQPVSRRKIAFRR